MNSILLFLLSFFARLIIRIHKPYVIGITWSIGKTTLTTAIANYLKIAYGKTLVGSSPYHYNGEYGLPLTIIGAKTGGKNPFLWMIIFIKAIWVCIRPYPKYLVLEYGIDHPGEMEYLLSIVRPDISILTPVAPNHLEQFGTFERYLEAKLLLVSSAKSHSIVHESLREKVTHHHSVSFYGKEKTSNAYIDSAFQNIDGIIAEIINENKNYSITLPSFGLYQAENILPLYILSSFLQIDPTYITKNTNIFTPEAGRSRILKGKNSTTIIDGSYNGGFEAICRGIDSLLPFVSTHRIICLVGDMRELGEHAEEIHIRLGNYIVEKLGKWENISLFLVWPLMQKYIFPITNPVLPTVHSLSSRILWEKIRVILGSEDISTIVYVKWSQNTIFLEEWVKEFLENPIDIPLLCRQSQDWLRKKNEFFKTIQQ